MDWLTVAKYAWDIGKFLVPTAVAGKVLYNVEKARRVTFLTALAEVTYDNLQERAKSDDYLRNNGNFRAMFAVDMGAGCKKAGKKAPDLKEWEWLTPLLRRRMQADMILASIG